MESKLSDVIKELNDEKQLAQTNAKDIAIKSQDLEEVKSKYAEANAKLKQTEEEHLFTAESFESYKSDFKDKIERILKFEQKSLIREALKKV